MEVLCSSALLFRVLPKVFGIWMHMFCLFSKAAARQVGTKGSEVHICKVLKFPERIKCYCTGKNARTFVMMDVTFHEDIPYYSSSKKLIHEEDEGSMCLFFSPYLHHSIKRKLKRWTKDRRLPRQEKQQNCQRNCCMCTLGEEKRPEHCSHSCHHQLKLCTQITSPI